MIAQKIIDSANEIEFELLNGDFSNTALYFQIEELLFEMKNVASEVKDFENVDF